MSEIPDDIKIARATASIFEAAVHKHFPRYVDVCTINDALDTYAAERQRHAEVMEEVRKVLESICAGGIGVSGAAIIIGYPEARAALDAARALLSRLEER